MARFSQVLSRAVLFGILAVGCKDDSPTLCQVTLFTYNDAGNSYTQTFTYNSDYKVIAMKITYLASESNYIYSYGLAGVITSAETAIEGTAGTMKFDYDALLRLTRATSESGNQIDTTVYIYNEYDQLIQSVNRTSVGVIKDTLTMVYTYPDIVTKNPSSISYNSTGIAPYMITYVYDTHVEPTREIFPSIKHPNNIVSMEKTGVVTTFTYLYNSLGYPISSESSAGPRSSWGYKCQ